MPSRAPKTLLTGYHPPLGPNIAIDSNTAALVKKAFELFATGLHTKTGVLKIVSGEGLRTAKGRYAYYHCQEKSCRAVSVKRELLHRKFLNWLEHLTPEPEPVKNLKDTIRAVWKQRRGDANSLAYDTQRKIV